MARLRKPSELDRAFGTTMRSPDAVLEEALARVLVSPYDNPAAIRGNFSLLVGLLEANAHEVFTKAEREAGEWAIRSAMLKLLPPKPTAEDAVQVASGMFTDLNAFFLSRAQSRKSRG